jgi:hypothetical protein
MSETLFLILQNTTCADGVYPFYHVCLILEKDRLNLIGTRTLLVIYLYLNAFFCAYPSKFDVPSQDVGRHAKKLPKQNTYFPCSCAQISIFFLSR